MMEEESASGFNQNDGSCSHLLHSVEECKRKRTDEESHVRTKKRSMVQKDIP